MLAMDYVTEDIQISGKGAEKIKHEPFHYVCLFIFLLHLQLCISPDEHSWKINLNPFANDWTMSGGSARNGVVISSYTSFVTCI